MIINRHRHQVILPLVPSHPRHFSFSTFIWNRYRRSTRRVSSAWRHHSEGSNYLDFRAAPFSVLSSSLLDEICESFFVPDVVGWVKEGCYKMHCTVYMCSFTRWLWSCCPALTHPPASHQQIVNRRHRAVTIHLSSVIVLRTFSSCSCLHLTHLTRGFLGLEYWSYSLLR